LLEVIPHTVLSPIHKSYAIAYNMCMVKIIKKTTKGDVSKAVLASVKAAGLLAASLVAPNVLQIFGKRGIIDISKRGREIIVRARDNLVRSGCLKKNHKGYLELTNKGKEKLRSYELSDYTLVIPRIWDKKWRVLIFDIPEYRKQLRNKIRNTLISIGFLRVQDSVWMFPYDCEELVALLKADFKVGKDLLYLIVEKIENDHVFRKWFGLSK